MRAYSSFETTSCGLEKSFTRGLDFKNKALYDVKVASHGSSPEGKKNLKGEHI
jgi:hypothetical protein